MASAQKAIQTIGSWGDEVNGFVQDRTGNGAVAITSDLPCSPQAGLATGPAPNGTPTLPSNIGKCFEVGANVAAGAATTSITIATAGAGQPAGNPGVIVSANQLPNVNAPALASGEFPYCIGQHFYYLMELLQIVVLLLILLHQERFLL